MKKLLSHRGESILEILIALLIVVLCIEAMQVSIVAANHINQETRDTDVFSFRYDYADGEDFQNASKNVSLKVTGDYTLTKTVPQTVVQKKEIAENGDITWKDVYWYVDVGG